MIPLVYEHDWKPNVWFPNTTGYDRKDIHRSLKHGRQIPAILKQCKGLKIFKPCDIPNLSCFIYPIIMQEPTFQAQVIIQNNHEDWGLWSYIDKQVINALRANKGYILIDITIEPPLNYTIRKILSALEDCSQFPNNRIIINSFSPSYVKHPKVYNLPSFLEIHNIAKDYGELKYNERVFDKKIFTMFNMRSEKHTGSLLAISILDRLNLLKKGHVSVNLVNLDTAWQNIKHQLPSRSKLRHIKLQPIQNVEDIHKKHITISDSLALSNVNIVIEAYYNDHAEYGYPLITEKIWRNIPYKKPFIVVGHKNTLSHLRSLGYKTFHPYIDETYDSLHDDYRVKAAMNEVVKLINFTDKEWINFMHNITPILEHNISNYSNRLQDIHNLIELLLNNKL